MGKRKYESEQLSSANLSQDVNNTEQSIEDENLEQPQSVDADGNKSAKKQKIGGFDLKHFRKELTSKPGQTMVLTQFLQVCLNPDNDADYLLEYLKGGGNSHEILRQINQEGKKNLTLTTPAFHLFHLIILKVQSSLPHLISITEEACRYFLNNFMSTVEIMISENSGPRHRKIILKLLTSMVTLNPDLGIEVLSHAPLTPKNMQYIVEKINYKEKDNVRTAFVNFMTSFLVDGHLPLVKALLEKQGLLALVFPGLVQDEADAVLMFLNILKKNVVENTFISKSLKLKTFSHQVLHNLFRLFSWKGPPDLNHEVRNEMRSEVMSLLTEILITLFTSHKLGLYFVDNAFGTTDVNKNQNLYKALLTLKRPWENNFECEAILEIVHKCPDLHRAVMSIVEQSFEPQHTPIWERTVDFSIRLLDKMKPENVMTRMQHLNASQTANFIRFVALPVPLLKFIQTNLGKDNTISLYCTKVLLKMLQTLKKYMHILEMENNGTRFNELKNKLEYFLPKHLPVPTVLVALIEDVISSNDAIETNNQDYKLPKISSDEALINLSDLLLLYNDIQPAFFEMLEGNIDMNKILEYANILTSGNIALLKFKIVSLWLTLDGTAISLKNPMFKDLFLIMLEVYTSTEDNTWMEAKNTLHGFLKNTAIFEADEDEIHLVLHSLRHSKIHQISLVADIVEYVLTNINDLTDNIRNQLVNFEISDEGTETSLEKLFDDLIENRNTEDCVFLENRIPSAFVVGCIQFIQTNKDAKKHLKHFLSLYIANLFHYNYSPELTEVLIGDSKLDVRSYITSWVSQSTSLSEGLVGNDDILKHISRSVIDKEPLGINEVFTFLSESMVEDADLILNEVSYKFVQSVDCSDLLIWAKYLIFCTIRLCNIGQLDAEQQMKITNYFHLLLTVGKRKHLMNECRDIVLALAKNPHFLKIFRPLMSKGSDSNTLATEFLLDIINKHSDIINYLNDKHKILKSYQQKNCNEIIKAFVKINKRKNLESTHTVKVLETIGLTNEDDLQVFSKIFVMDTSHCVKDDKDPSFVLDVMATLIKKYATSVTVDPPEHVIRKSMKLYSEILISKDITANLISLETVLVHYFENKPHHTAFVNDEIFIRFFNASVIRKTTSQLASILIKHNLKLCNVFKEQISRPEIVSQRELALPLGNAIIGHKQFLIDNKEILIKMYEEYKVNITKMLEKPHKAGQIYISCWKFVKKLIIECMDESDCQKMLGKIHKFEVVELSHINLYQNVFLKLFLKENSLKNDYFFNYILTILHIITVALKEDKDTAVIKEIVENISNILTINRNISAFKFEQKEDFKKITESAIWQNFCKTTLKVSLKVKTTSQTDAVGPHLLYLLTDLIKIMYLANHEDISTLFEMVTSHSEFLNVMLSHHSSDVKSRLLQFLYTLIQLNKSVMKTQQIPVYLSSYHATRSPCDRLILAILHYYETNGLAVNEWKPYVFGDSAANHYSVRKTRASSLYGHPTPNRVLNLFDRDIIHNTVKMFPVTQKLEYHYELPYGLEKNVSLQESLHNMYKNSVLKVKSVKDNEMAINLLIAKCEYENVFNVDGQLTTKSHLNEDDQIYDPVFLFPLLSHLLAPGTVASCFKIMRTGLLSVTVMALSSQCPLMRAAAYHVLHRFCLLLETETRHKNDKLFLSDFVNTLRQTLLNANVPNVVNGDLKNPKLPAVNALYLARALTVSTAPSDPLYRPVNNFFIAKQHVDLSIIADFLTLFHDSDVEAIERRDWILQVIKDGVKTMDDVNVVFKTMCLKMILDFYSSVLCDRKIKDRILSVINSIISIPRCFEIMLEGYGLLSWLHAAIKQLTKNDKIIVSKLLKIVENIMSSVVINLHAKSLTSPRNGNKYNEIKVNKDIENELLKIITELLCYIDLLDNGDVVLYVRLCNIMTKRGIKSLSKKQIFTIVGKVGARMKNLELVKLLSNAVVNNDSIVLKSKFIDFDNCDVMLKELVTLVNVYIT